LGYEVVTRLLLVNGANPDIVDNFGDTSLLLAARCGHDAIVHLFLIFLI
jgi:ankyrin repeat protein